MSLVGAGLQHWVGWQDASELGFLAGIFVALLVPTGKSACRIS